MSKIVRFHATGGPEVLTLDDVEVREPGQGEIRIRTRALGVNRADATLRSGHLMELPSGIGWEASAEIDAIGPNVEGFTLGDAINVIPCFKVTDYPIHGELAIAPATGVVKHPDTLSWEEAAALWGPYLTAYGALIETAALKAGDTLLVPAASSSVGLAAIQIARIACAGFGVVAAGVPRPSTRNPRPQRHPHPSRLTKTKTRCPGYAGTTQPWPKPVSFMSESATIHAGQSV